MHQNVSTPLEPCRVAPYVNVPRLPQLQFNSSAAAAAAFSAFDPAILTAAQQVIVTVFLTKYKKKDLKKYFIVNKTYSRNSFKL